MKIKMKGKYIKIVLAGMFAYLILFTCACLYITYKTGSEPDTLILSVFAFCGVEGGLSAWIKVTKEKKPESGAKKTEKEISIKESSTNKESTKEATAKKGDIKKKNTKKENTKEENTKEANTKEANTDKISANEVNTKKVSSKKVSTKKVSTKKKDRLQTKDGGPDAQELRNSIVAYACQFVALPYVWGGTSLVRGADCSGFAQAIFKDKGIKLPRTSRQQAVQGKEVAIDKIQPADLVFYGSKGVINHVAIYIGDGKVISASSKKTGVRITKYDYRQPYKAVSYIDKI